MNTDKLLEMLFDKALKREQYMIWFTLLYIIMVITLGGLFWIIKESSKLQKGEQYDRQSTEN